MLKKEKNAYPDERQRIPETRRPFPIAMRCLSVARRALASRVLATGYEADRLRRSMLRIVHEHHVAYTQTASRARA